MKIIIIYSFIVLSLLSKISAQEIPKGYFRSPLDIPLFLAGNFGEIRNNHFHAGLDMKTESVEGKNIYAAADGYVSRIKIGKGGYGRALYITHPNGYTTVYAHLQKYTGEIGSYVKKAQYQKESYEIELFPAKNALEVKKGDIVALSGNSGGSGGPHLHFEIRETDTEIPINPLLFGFEIKDNIKPTLKKIGIYPVKGKGLVNGESASKLLEIVGSNGVYKMNTPLKMSGQIAMGIEVLDKLNGSSNRCGVYSIELLIDSQEVYCHEMDKIGFHETRYINSHVHFYDWKKNNARVQRSYLQPNNKLDVYNCNKNTFVYDFKDDKKHLIQYVITDSYGNLSRLEFMVQSVIQEIKPVKAVVKEGVEVKEFKENVVNSFATEKFKVTLPAKVLYDDIVFEYSTSAAKGRSITPIYKVHSMYEPLHSYMSMSIKVGNLPDRLQDKALIVALDNEYKVIAAEGGMYADGWLTVKTRSFGFYTVMVDTIPPRVKAFNVVSGRDMTSRGKLQMSISDELSGINTYRGAIDGKWVLMEYDYKLNRLTYFFDETRLEKGKKHNFTLVVTDKQGNESDYSIGFLW